MLEPYEGKLSSTVLRGENGRNIADLLDEIMMNESARIGFLSAVLKINPENIKKTRILNTYLRKEHEEDKQGILDVRVLLNDDTEIDIEIHLSELRVWADRALFYLSKMYTEQIKQGQKYDIFKRCVSISILDFKLFKETDEYYSCFHIREDKRNTILTDKMEFHILELPKLPKELKENSDDLLLWAKFISSEREEDFKMLAMQNKHIESAYEQLKLISQDEQKRLEYEAREKAIRDYNQMMFEAEQRGRESGIEEGKKEGRAEGKAEGKAEAYIEIIKDGLISIADAAKKLDMSEETLKKMMV